MIMGFVFFSLNLAQVGINTSTPDPSAILDLGPGNKGLIIPSIALTSLKDVTTIPNPTHSLLIFNTTNDPSKKLIGNSFYYYNKDTDGIAPDESEWRSLIDTYTAKAYLENLRVPAFVAQIYKTNQQNISTSDVRYLNGNFVNVIKFDSGPTTEYYSSDYIVRKTGTTSTFRVLKSGYYVFEGFATWKFTLANTATVFWTVAIESGSSLSDAIVDTPAAFTYGMRCPYYNYEAGLDVSSTCNFTGAVHLTAGTEIRLVAVRKNGTAPTAGQIGDGINTSAGLKITYYP